MWLENSAKQRRLANDLITRFAMADLLAMGRIDVPLTKCLGSLRSYRLVTYIGPNPITQLSHFPSGISDAKYVYVEKDPEQN
ncbi:MAG: hypothetical protein ACI92Z_000303 [Paracoccaceae bacterium]